MNGALQKLVGIVRLPAWMLALSLLCFGATPAGAADWPRSLAPLPQLVDAFRDMAFPGQQPFGGAHTRLMRWTGKMTVILHGPAAPSRVGMVQRELFEVSMLTGVQITSRRARQGEKFAFPGWKQVRLWFGPKSDMTRRVRAAVGHRHRINTSRLRGTNCVAFYYAGNRHNVDRGIIYSATDTIQGAGPRCVYHELMHVMGLGGHTTKVASILVSGGEIQRPTLNDRVIFRAFYDPRLRRGMGETRAMPIAQKILVELAARLAASGQDALHLAPAR